MADRARAAGADAGRVVRFGDVCVDLAARTVARAGVPVALAPKHFALLATLLRAGGGAVSRLDLLREVWGYAADTRTLDLHVMELRQRLEDVLSAPRWIRMVRTVGYRLERDATAGRRRLCGRVPHRAERRRGRRGGCRRARRRLQVQCEHPVVVRAPTHPELAPRHRAEPLARVKRQRARVARVDAQ